MSFVHGTSELIAGRAVRDIEDELWILLLFCFQLQTTLSVSFMPISLLSWKIGMPFSSVTARNLCYSRCNHATRGVVHLAVLTGDLVQSRAHHDRSHTRRTCIFGLVSEAPITGLRHDLVAELRAFQDHSLQMVQLLTLAPLIRRNEVTEICVECGGEALCFGRCLRLIWREVNTLTAIWVEEESR